ncbi:protein angel homolog 2-like [Asterias rubens]|uniref:protein angel homolog 2-like n=1 Tax=Asterias rubens TaxID=7604 RepID=UPI001455BB02|nr:protein angel homolog 2-like [Asterias rubens]XP_033630403.1 protein angel homolog 2-like [Asterias rubens]
MFCLTTLATWSSRSRAGCISLPKLLMKSSKMQGCNQSQSAMVFQNLHEPRGSSSRNQSSQPGINPPGVFGQGVTSQENINTNTMKDARPCTYQQSKWPPSYFPHPPATSFHSRSHRPRSPYEQPQSRQSLHSSSTDRRKQIDTGKSASTSSSNRASSSHSDQRGVEGGSSASDNQGEEDPSEKAPRPDLSKFCRKWTTTSFGRQRREPGQTSDFEVTILSYNVLAQCLIESNMTLYQHCHSDFLRWRFRKKNLLREIKEADADILCLQEIQACHLYDFFAPQLEKLGYTGIYQKRTGDKNDGCAIFYKVDKLVQDKTRRVSFYMPNIQLMDRDNVALIALLRPKAWPEDGPKLCVATTHLLYNPRRGDIKLAQLGMLLAEIDSMAAITSPPPTHHQKPSYYPVILCGDFNSTPHYPLFNFIKYRELNYVGLPRTKVSGQETGRRIGDSLYWPLWPYEVGVTDTCQFRSVIRERLRHDQRKKMKYGKKSGSGDTPVLSENWENEFAESIRHSFPLESVHSHKEGFLEVTTNHSSTNCAVDYIFYSKSGNDDEAASSRRCPSNRLGGLKLLGYRSLLTDEEANEMGGLPNHVWSSDHFMLLAKFLLTSGK